MQIVLVSLSNVSGTVVSEKVLPDQPWHQVQFTDLSAGIYFVHIQGRDPICCYEGLGFLIVLFVNSWICKRELSRIFSVNRPHLDHFLNPENLG